MERVRTPYLFSRALRDVWRDGVDLIMHLDAPSLPASNAHQEHPEVRAAKIQGQEVSALCRANTTDSESISGLSLVEIHIAVKFCDSEILGIFNLRWGKCEGAQ